MAIEAIKCVIIRNRTRVRGQAATNSFGGTAKQITVEHRTEPCRRLVNVIENYAVPRAG